MTYKQVEHKAATKNWGTRACNEDGTAIVETAVVMLFVVTIIAGILDYAALFGNTIDVSAATRLAARTGASTTTAVIPDYKTVEAVTRKPGVERQGIKRIVVYKAEAGSTGPPDECKTAAQSLPEMKCNIYLPSDFELRAAMPDGDGWPLSSRIPGEDYLGVWVDVERVPLFGGLLWSPSRYSDYAVMRLESIATPMASGHTGFSTGTNRDPGLGGDYCIGGGCEIGGTADPGGSGGGGST